MIVLFAVPPVEDEAFRATWEAEAPPGQALYRALGEEARFRFAGVPDGAEEGVLLIAAPFAFGALEGHRGFIGARVDGTLAAVFFSSPLMHHRAVRAGLAPAGTLYQRVGGGPRGGGPPGGGGRAGRGGAP